MQRALSRESVCCTLQHTATHCNTLQHTAARFVARIFAVTPFVCWHGEALVCVLFEGVEGLWRVWRVCGGCGGFVEGV